MNIHRFHLAIFIEVKIKKLSLNSCLPFILANFYFQTSGRKANKFYIYCILLYTFAPLFHYTIGDVRGSKLIRQMELEKIDTRVKRLNT